MHARLHRVVVAALATLLAGTVVVIPRDAYAEGREKWWVFLPRASSSMVRELDGLPYPPPPNERAHARRALRGREDRVQVLGRGPDPGALQRVIESGATVVAVSRWLSAISVHADARAVESLRAGFGPGSVHPVRTLRGVRRTPAHPILPVDLPRRADAPFAYGASGPQLEQIQVDRLHARGLTGHGVRVLVLDTGFWLDHPAFGELAVVAEYDFVFDDAFTANDPEQDPFYQHRHGTGVLGVVAGLDEGRLIGAAPRAEVLLAKTEWVSTETRIEEDAFVRALEWGEALGADVMTASLGYRMFPDEPDSFAYAPEDFDGDTAVTTRAVDDLVALGVVAVTSAGNGGPEPQTLLTPADADSVLAIAAVDSLGVIVAFSSRGPTADGRIKPDLAARGRLTVWAETIGGDYAAVNGTSLSAPLVGGTVALVLEAHPDWGPGQVMDALRATASQADAPDDDLGWGLVRAHDAVFAVAEPQWPLPFDPIEPGAGDSVSASAVGFRWTRAVDLQTPDAVQYTIELGADPDFGDLFASYDAGLDTSMVVTGAPAGSWWWRVRAADPEGHARFSRARAVTFEQATAAPAGSVFSAWSAPWPNPTAGTSQLRLRLVEAVSARIEVFDVSGRRVRTLVADARWPRGERLLQWDGSDDNGRPAASGAYFVRASLRGPRGTEEQVTARVIVVR
jgi:hypothetical protein